MANLFERLQTSLRDRYRVERELGQGGMALVFLAEDLRHERKVALKVLKPELSAILGAERFLNEIKLTAHLQHPHILPLYDSGSADGLLWYVMPYIGGDSLRHRLLREKQLSVDDAVRITTQVASALEYAHRHGLIHRDIKPENILLDEEQAMVSDFGIALAVRSAGGARLTETGLSLGTPQYMSPEQATGERELDARSDIFSLASVTYEMLVGDPPHTGSTVQAVIGKLLSERPRPIHEIRHTVPAHVAYAIERALEKLPADRFTSAAEFAAALEGKGAVSPAVGRATAADRVRRIVPRSAAVWLIVGAAVGAVITYALLAGVTGRAEGPERWSVGLPDSAPLVFVGQASLGLGQRAIAASPDGSRIVYVGQHGNTTALFAHELGTFDVGPLKGSEGAYNPFFSPDGRWVGFFAGGRLKKVDLDQGPVTTLAEVVEPFGGAWMDDGRIVVANREGRELAWIPVAGGNPNQIATRPHVVLQPFALPHSPWVLGHVGFHPGLLAVVSAESGETKFLTRSGPPAASNDRPDLLYGRSPVFLEPSYLLFTAPTDNVLMATRFDRRSLRVDGDPLLVLSDLRQETVGAQYAVSRTGGLVFVTGENANAGLLVWADGSGKLDTLRLPEAVYGSFEVSPDGRQLAVAVASTEGPHELRLYNLNDPAQGPQERWRPPNPLVIAPIWASPRSLIVPTRALGALMLSLPLGSGIDTLPGNFAPFGMMRGGNSVLGIWRDDVAVLGLDGGGEPETLIQRPGRQTFASPSPDGRMIAYTSEETGQTGRWEVFLETYPPTDWRDKVSLAGGEEPLWSPRGDRLFYRYQETWYAVPVDTRTRRTGSPVHFVTGPFVNVPGFSYDVSLDGNRLLLIQGPAEKTAGHLRVIRDFRAEIERALRAR